VATLTSIFGPDGDDVVFTGEVAQDRQRAADFTAKAREQNRVSLDPKKTTREFLVIGNDDWPFPIPLIKKILDGFSTPMRENRSSFTGASARMNWTLFKSPKDTWKRSTTMLSESGKVTTLTNNAQRIISTPGKQDGLAWQNPDGTWDGPIGDEIARAIEQGYSRSEPHHGYFFKVLTSQGRSHTLAKWTTL